MIQMDEGDIRRWEDSGSMDGRDTSTLKLLPSLLHVTLILPGPEKI